MHPSATRGKQNRCLSISNCLTQRAKHLPPTQSSVARVVVQRQRIQSVRSGNATSIGILERSLQTFDPTRPFRRASPDGGSLHTYPDMDAKLYNRVPYMSETGMHNIPEPESIREVVNATELNGAFSNLFTDDFVKAHPDFIHHFVEYQPTRVPRMLSRASHIADMNAPTLEAISEATQIGAGEFYQIASEAMQANYPTTTGLMPWVLKRPWPVVAIMLAIYFGQPNAPYYFLKRTYEPTHFAVKLPEIIWAAGEQIPVTLNVLQVRFQLLDRHTVYARRAFVTRHLRVRFEQVLSCDHCCHQFQHPFRSDGLFPCRVFDTPFPYSRGFRPLPSGRDSGLSAILSVSPSTSKFKRQSFLPVRAFAPVAGATMPSADFCRFITPPLGDPSPVANRQPSPGIAHPPSRFCPPHIRQDFPCRYWTLSLLALSSSLAASYAISVRQASVLPAASFRFHLTMDTLAVRLTIPPAGFVWDFHPPVNVPCRAHQIKMRLELEPSTHWYDRIAGQVYLDFFSNFSGLTLFSLNLNLLMTHSSLGLPPTALVRTVGKFNPLNSLYSEKLH